MAGPVLGVLPYVITFTTASILAYSPKSILSTDRPVHLALSTLVCTSFTLAAVGSRTRAKRLDRRSINPAYSPVAGEDSHDGDAKLERGISRLRSPALSSRSLLLVILGAAIALTARIELQRRLLLASECATRSIEVWLPFLVAVYDALRFQTPGIAHQQDLDNDEAEDAVDATAYQDLNQHLKIRLLSSPWRYVPVIFLLCMGCHLVAGLWMSSESSHVCPQSSSDLTILPHLQWLALLLDTGLAVAAFELSLGGVLASNPLIPIPNSWLAVTGSAVSGWSVLSMVLISLQPEHRDWFLFRNETALMSTLFHLLGQSLFLSTLIVSILYSVGEPDILLIKLTVWQIVTSDLLQVSTALTVLFVLIPGFRFIWVARRPFPPISSKELTWSFVLVYFAWSIYQRMRRALHHSEEQPSSLRRLLTSIFFIILLYPGLMKSNTVYYHPITLLMYDAQTKYLEYLNGAARSNNIAEAVQIYRNRYHDNPPPGFDIWFDYAKNRSVWITDEFDQIHNDLSLFRVVAPSDLRRQTWEMVSNPWNEISGISVRNGQAYVQDNVLPTHRWMLEGVVHLIDKFSQHLPDMDLAFNLNDESRTAPTCNMLRVSRSEASKMHFRGNSRFSTARDTGWQNVSTEPISETVFENWSFSNTFQEWAASTCPESSAARRNVAPLFRSQLCLDCAADHSLGQFVANWSIAADPCHQPDLANLHGFYISPAAFKATHEPRPVFSQSKAPGFSDILYPSAWNYMDKVVYAPTNLTGESNHPSFPDPPFSEKNSSLFWRGATSEGVSTGLGEWRGMARQRLVHMANNLTTSPHDHVTLLLPDQRHPDRFTYTNLAGSSLPSLNLQTDIHIVSSITRCGGRDCSSQATELGLVSPTDFQSHWNYKYLIDLDGAGFSGRFIPFLQSGSLPFKAALFREWYSSRLIPWLHFVPLDIRLHGLWSTLAYFSGVQGTDPVSGTTWNWKGHEREAVLIAEGGREWSKKVLRKEDMEVYFFRLLLEWGRLTDDNRENLGFTVPS